MNRLKSRKFMNNKTLLNYLIKIGRKPRQLEQLGQTQENLEIQLSNDTD